MAALMTLLRFNQTELQQRSAGETCQDAGSRQKPFLADLVSRVGRETDKGNFVRFRRNVPDRRCNFGRYSVFPLHRAIMSALLGRDGADQPVVEMWMGTHRLGPSHVEEAAGVSVPLSEVAGDLAVHDEDTRGRPAAVAAEEAAGNISIRPDHTIVELPENLPSSFFDRVKKTRISGQLIHIEADGGPPSTYRKSSGETKGGPKGAPKSGAKGRKPRHQRHEH